MTTNRRKANRRRGDRGNWAFVPVWLGIAAGLGIGLAAAGAIYWKDHRATPPGSLVEQPATGEPPGPGKPGRSSPKGPGRTAGDSSTPADAPGRFQFYDMLPKFEVVVPEVDKKVRPGAITPPVETPGIYVLQAGSFPDFAEADAVKAKLALLGIVSQIQTVTVDNRTFNRVRIGPVEDLGELNRLRTRLRQSRIDFLVIQVGE